MEGPGFAVGDVNGDGLDDVYIGGAKQQSGQVLLQQRDGTFRPAQTTAFRSDEISEDVGAAFFDADGDGDQDLYVVSGGNEYSDRASALQDRLYFNDGRGSFAKVDGNLPTEFVSGSRAIAADYDGDGDVDLFVGGRVVPWRYGTTPQSMLLRNDGGRFSDVTAQLAPALAGVGMVTDAVWQDVDGDRRLDLVAVGEWMPITVFRNLGSGRLEKLTVRGLEKSNGWWNRVVARDVTGDGRIDFVVGNLGLNSRLSASGVRPMTMYVKDFDGNGFVEQVVSIFNDSVSYPLPLRDDLLSTLPTLRARFPKYEDYALAKVTDIFTADELNEAIVREAHTFASSIVRNNGDGSFTLVPLPLEAQVAPVYGILPEDVDGDGKVDLLLAGNFDGFKPDIGRMSSGRGLLLRGNGRGGFEPVHASASGFVVPGQVRDVLRLRTRAGARFVIPRNNDRPLVFGRGDS
jgi:enediyne biosynthesis protein E4